MIEQFEGVDVEIHHVESEHVITLTDVSKALGVNKQAIHNILRRYKDEFTEEDTKGVTICDPLGKNKQRNRVFTKSGIIQLCFFVKSPKAAAFRKWAKKTLTKIMDGTYEVIESSTKQKVDVLADLMVDLAYANHLEAAERIRVKFGEELPPPPTRKEFAAAIQKEGYDFGLKWYNTLRTAPRSKIPLLIAPGVGPTKPRRRKK